MEEQMQVSAQVVKEAAAWLDGVEPGWHKRIDKKTLNMAHCDKCIYGQLHGDYVVGQNRYTRRDAEGAERHYAAFNHPTNFAPGEIFLPYCEALQAFWIAEIDARLKADKERGAGLKN